MAVNLQDDQSESVVAPLRGRGPGTHPVVLGDRIASGLVAAVRDLGGTGDARSCRGP
jgi:hypothetical protein